MAQATLRRLLSCLLALVVSGCAGDMAGNPGFGGLPPDVWDEDLLNTHRELFTRPIVQDCLRQPRNSAERRDCRDRITFARMRYSDLVFERYRHRLFYGSSGMNYRSRYRGARTEHRRRTRDGNEASRWGFGRLGRYPRDRRKRDFAERDYSDPDPQNGGAAGRGSEPHSRIACGATSSVYSFEAAEIDAGDYFRAGTLHNALIALQGDSAYGLSYQKARLDQPLTAPAPWPQPAAVPQSAPAFAPVPAPAISPGTVGPVLPPPLPGVLFPAPATQPMSDEPAVARMKLREALGQGVDGKGHRDPARLTLFKKCATNLGIVVPPQISLWMEGASAETLTKVADCIHREAAATQGGRR